MSTEEYLIYYMKYQLFTRPGSIFLKIEEKLYFYEQAVLHVKYTNSLQYCFACPPEALDWAPWQGQILTPRTPSITRSYHPNQYQTIPARIQLYQNSFFPRTIIWWNALPASLVTSPSVVDRDTQSRKRQFRDRDRKRLTRCHMASENFDAVLLLNIRVSI